MRIHYIGIGGVGVSALAEVSLARGDAVTGSDRAANPITERLVRRGASIWIGQSAEAMLAARPERVVYSAAITESNPELAAARQAGATVMTRAECLGRLMDEAGAPRIAVAGTHGKTTTTCMVAAALAAVGLDPTVLVGGDYAPFGGNVRLGNGPFVAEACEAFRSFLELRPDLAIVTNVERDHLECYGDLAGVVSGFRAFVGGVRPGGSVVLCDEGETMAGLAQHARSLGLGVVRYGAVERPGVETEALTIWADMGCEMGADGEPTVWHRTGPGPARPLGPLLLRMPGRHNVLNALAAVETAILCGADGSAALAGLAGFGGVERRFDVLGERNGVTVVDDYAHHPTEVAATIAGARSAYPGRRLLAVFQPHLYSRTRDLLPEFAEALGAADAVIVAGVYGAREEPIAGVDASLLSARVAAVAPRATVITEPNRQRVPVTLATVARAGDVVLIMGAGDIREAGEAYLRQGPGAGSMNTKEVSA